LDYAVNRYYSTQSARFLTADRGPYMAANPQSFNRYTYGWSDPVNNNDKDGLAPANVSFDGGFGCVATPSLLTSSPGTVDASSPCPPGSSIQFSGGPGLQTRTQQVAAIFEPLAGIIEDWDYANRQGTAFNVALSTELFGWMTSSGTAVMTQPGVYVIGGFLVRIVVTAAAVAGSPVVMTIAGVGAAAAVGYTIYMAGRDLRQVRNAAREVSREEGCRQPANDDYERVLEVIADQKGPNGMVPYDVLLDAWREVLCN
jgi:hypothetical protein